MSQRMMLQGQAVGHGSVAPKVLSPSAIAKSIFQNEVYRTSSHQLNHISRFLYFAWFHCAHALMQGLKGFFRGYTASIATFAPSSAIWWMSYNFCRRWQLGGIKVTVELDWCNAVFNLALAFVRVHHSEPPVVQSQPGRAGMMNCACSFCFFRQKLLNTLS
jgi:hypothetical protein